MRHKGFWFFLIFAFAIGFGFGTILERHRMTPAPRVSLPAEAQARANTMADNKDFGYTVTGETIYKGQAAMVPEWQWVDVERYLNGQLPDKDEDTCGIEPGGRVTAIGVVNDQVLVSYEPPDGGTAGTPCDGGEVFFLKVVDFISYTGRAEAFAKQELERKRLVNSLLR